MKKYIENFFIKCIIIYVVFENHQVHNIGGNEMKRRQFFAILTAMVLVVSTSAVLTGCAGRSYYYKDGVFTEIVEDSEEATAASSAASSTSTESSSSESSATESSDESSTESSTESSAESSTESSVETPAESSEESSAESSEESTAESSEESSEKKEGIIATIKFKKPDNWGNEVKVMVSGDRAMKATNGSVPMELGDDGLYTYDVPGKTYDTDEEIENPIVNFFGKVDGKIVQYPKNSERLDVVDGNTYEVEE